MDYKKILNGFKDKKILVIGDLILDRYIWGKVKRISPEAPVPVVEFIKEELLLGGASNVANNIIALGGSATLVGVIGKDTTGKKLLRLLKNSGVNTEGIIYSSRPTTVKTRIIAHNQQVVRLDREKKDKVEGKILRDLVDYIRRDIKKHNAIIISDYMKGVVSVGLMKEVLKHSKSRNIFVSVDPKIGNFHCYKNVSIITPNITEASIATGVEIKDENTLIQAGRTLLKMISCEAVLITRGEYGMSIFEKRSVRHIPTVARHVYDVTGAGDTVIAAFTLARAAGASMEESAVIANHAAGIVVGKVGTAVPLQEELQKSLEINSYY